MHCRYKEFMYTCPYEGHSVPYAVSVVARPCDVPRAVLPVINNSMSKLHNGTFGVCVSPIFNGYNNALMFVENLEVNRLFGADYFMFYNISMGSDVDKLMRSYIRDGLAGVIQWKLPHDINHQGQLTAINDCLYRLSSKVSYILFADLDELAVPRIHDNWRELIRYSTHNGTFPSIGSFNFRSAVYPPRRTHDASHSDKFDAGLSPYNLNTILRVNRSKYIWKGVSRAKCIAVARKVNIAGIHFVTSHFGNYKRVILNVSVGLLHHYRAGLLQAGYPTVSDRTMLRFQKKISSAVADRFQRVKLSLR